MFNPYHKWLGIPEGNGPPSHYQLLGIARAETDPDVIQAAAVRQSSYVRNFQTGKYASDATRLLNEIAKAKACLLDLAERAKYDAALEAAEALPKVANPQPQASSASPYHLAPIEQPEPVPPWAPGPARQPSAGKPRPAGGVPGPASSRPPQAPTTSRPLDDLPVLHGPGAAIRPTKTTRSAGSARKKQSPWPVIGIVVGVIAMVAVAIALKRSKDITVEVREGEGAPGSSTSPTSRTRGSAVPRHESKDPKLEAQIAKSAADLKAQVDKAKLDAAPMREVEGEAAKLLEGVDVCRDGMIGKWRQERLGVVLTPAKEYGLVQVPGQLPEEYNLTAVVARGLGNGSFGIGLVAGKSRFMAIFDGEGGTASGLELVDGARIDNNPTRVAGHFLTKDVKTTLLFAVRKSGVAVSVNGKKIVEYTGSFDRLRLPAEAAGGGEGGLLIFSNAGEFVLYSLDLVGVSQVRVTN